MCARVDQFGHRSSPLFLRTTNDPRQRIGPPEGVLQRAADPMLVVRVTAFWHSKLDPWVSKDREAM
jgi:hypothetical protein